MLNEELPIISETEREAIENVEKAKKEYEIATRNRQKYQLSRKPGKQRRDNEETWAWHALEKAEVALEEIRHPKVNPQPCLPLDI